ncbi:MAG: hypothetical protein ACI3Z9_04785 [Candidatus Onthomorpha sp.]
MNKKITSTNIVKAFLAENIENFSSFVNQVIHDEEFLERVMELLPFDGVVSASMNVIPAEQVVRKMGLMVMRMDVEPSLFSLAVTITIDRGKNEKQQDISVFLTACKSIEELQEYVNGEKFRDIVIENCVNKIICDDEFLQDIVSLGNER